MSIPNEWKKLLILEAKPGKQLQDYVWVGDGRVDTDGDMELWDDVSNLTHWTKTIGGGSTVNRESTVVKSGTYSCRLDVDASSTFVAIAQTITLIPEQLYQLSFWVKLPIGQSCKWRLIDSGANVSLNTSGVWVAGSPSNNANGTGDWQQIEFMFYAHASYSTYEIRFTEGPAVSCSIYYDKFRVNAVYCTTFEHGEINELKVDGVALNKQDSLFNCHSNTDSYYQDFFNKTLCVNLGYDAPNKFTSPSYDHEVIAYVWKGFINRQRKPGNTISFIPEGCTYPIYYEPSLQSGSLSSLTAAIADHFESALQTTYGAVSLTNVEARWWAEIDEWYWNNVQARILTGSIGDSYSDLVKRFVGKLQNPYISDGGVTFDLVDSRVGTLQSIPPDHLSLDVYTNMPTDNEGLPIPILFGQKSNITPVCIDSVNHTYKISQTHFNGGTDVFELQSIDAVYLKGVGLSSGTHYTADLHNGEFSLTFDPGDAEVTCDAKGIKNQFLFDASPFGSATGVYSENIADHLFFVLHILNGIPISQINLDDFAELQTVRTQAVAWLLNEDTGTLDFNRLLQQTSLYHFLLLDDGTFTARYYKRGVPSDALKLRNYDHKNYRIFRSNDSVFRDVFLRYDKDPTTGTWKQLVNTNSGTEQRYGTKDPYVVETALRSELEAETVLTFYVELLKEPAKKLETTISLIGADSVPTDKFYNNRSVVADGKNITISEDEVYVILETRKNLQTNSMSLTGQLDTQLSIYTIHADVVHMDVPHSDHTDTLHSNLSHGDSHTDTPYDNHSDTTHSDSHTDSHTDEHEDHTDGAYEDAHNDVHSDVHQDMVGYVDHDDTPYADVPHVDTSHVDHSDMVHEDAHTDVPHTDSEV